jgi:transcriptional antiterminator Rof (Rho-off)
MARYQVINVDKFKNTEVEITYSLSINLKIKNMVICITAPFRKLKITQYETYYYCYHYCGANSVCL